MIERWMIRAYSLHTTFSELRVVIAPCDEGPIHVELKSGMIDKNGEGWDRAKLMWFWAELERYQGEYFYERAVDLSTKEIKSWRVYREKKVDEEREKSEVEKQFEEFKEAGYSDDIAAMLTVAQTVKDLHNHLWDMTVESDGGRLAIRNSKAVW